ncbi:MAG: 3'-5' exonuclease, partial [Bacteroidota bacterium]
CQDLNAAQTGVALKLAGSSGRVLGVGDRSQAIFGFAGAKHDSFERLQEALKAQVLPLSICYRCPTRHIDLLNAVFEDSKIESRDKAPDGVLRVKAEADLRADLTPGDLVLCRRTSPLVSLCMRLIAAGIPAIVKGRNIGKQIADLADDLYKMPGFDYTQLHDAADRYQAEMFARYANRDNEEQLKEQLKDKLDALMSIYDAQPQIESLEGIKAYIDRLFSDDEQVGVVEMSTCHRAKGLEAESVFLLQADSMPMEWRNQAQWQLQQEMNLLYVALSRSTKSLTLVSNESIPWLPDELNWLEEDELTDEDVESKFAEVRAANIQALAASTPRS